MQNLIIKKTGIDYLAVDEEPTGLHIRNAAIVK